MLTDIFRFPKPNENVQGGMGIHYTISNNTWKHYDTHDKYDKLYVTIVNVQGGQTCFDMELVVPGRKRREERFVPIEESSAIPESKGCNVFETCVQGECQCSGITYTV